MLGPTWAVARFKALVGAPPLPDGYHLEFARYTLSGLRIDVYFKGARVFEFDADLHFGGPSNARFVAQAVSNPQLRVESDDIASLLRTMLAQHRLGVF